MSGLRSAHKRRDDRPRRWISLDVDYLSRPRIIDLQQAFGAIGPMTFLAIVLETEKTNYGRATHSVEARYDQFAEIMRAAPDDVRAIVARAEFLRLLSIAHETDGVTGRKCDRMTLLERHRWAAPTQPNQRATRDQPGRIPTDERVINALADAGRPLRGHEIADELGLVCGGSFRSRLARLCREGRIARGKAGYEPVRAP